MKKYYVPVSDSGKAQWLQNFAAKLLLYASKYGISAAETTDMTQSDVYFRYWLNVKAQFEETGKRITAYKDELRDGIIQGTTASVMPTPPAFGTPPTTVGPNIFKRATTIVHKIKTHAAYTDADGQDLGIIGEDKNLNLANIKPEISLRLRSGKPELIWRKQGLDGIHIYVDRTGTGEYTFLNYKTKAYFIDNHILPPAGKSEVWFYKVMYIKNDEEIGVVSDVAAITVTGMI